MTKFVGSRHIVICLFFLFTDKKENVPSNLLTLELENERLQRQLLLLQDQKLISTNRRKDNREGMLDQQKPAQAATHLSLSKWVQTNPVPSVDAKLSALPPSNDYKTQRQLAKQALDNRWGESRQESVQNKEPHKSQSIGNFQKESKSHSQHPIGSYKNQTTSRTTEEIPSLCPEKELETIAEAANVDDYDPDQPLDLDLSAITPRKPNRVLFPFKPNLDEASLKHYVIVKGEKHYDRVNFYGQKLEEYSKIKENEIQKTQTALKWSQFPANRIHHPGQKLYLYDNLLQDMFQRSEDLIRYDPYYHSISRKGRYKSINSERRSDRACHELNRPALILDEFHLSGNSEGGQPKQGLGGSLNLAATQSANASVQTYPEDTDNTSNNQAAPRQNNKIRKNAVVSNA